MHSRASSYLGPAALSQHGRPSLIRVTCAWSSCRFHRFRDTVNPPSVGLFDLGLYGVPVALVAISYVILFSPFLLPGYVPKHTKSATGSQESELLVSARITKWSPACGKTVLQSDLRGLPGLYLVSVETAAGVRHRVVSPDLVLHEGDRLYFTGIVETLAQVCQEQGLEPITNENDWLPPPARRESVPEGDPDNPPLRTYLSEPLPDNGTDSGSFTSIGATREAFLASDRDTRFAVIAKLQDLIRNAGTEAVGSHGGSCSDSGGASPLRCPGEPGPSCAIHMALNSLAPATVVVAPDPTTEKKNIVFVGINSSDRPGLLHDISKGLSRLSLQVLRTEASVVGLRSISIWRCAVEGGLRAEQRRKYGVDETDMEMIWSVLNALLEAEGGIQAQKKKGLRVIRTRVMENSSLVGKTAEEAGFRGVFLAGIVAVVRGGKGLEQKLGEVRFEVGDVLLLQVGDDSVLLTKDFSDEQHALVQARRKSSTAAAVARTTSSAALDGNSIPRLVRDLYVETPMTFENGDVGEHEAEGLLRKEFLTAMSVKGRSRLVGRTMAQSGILKLPGLQLFSIERPLGGDANRENGRAEDSPNTGAPRMETLSPDEKLQGGDVLWWSGSGEAIMELRKIPGLNPYESEQVKKLGANNERRLVQAVVARKGPLVGKTIKQLKFRTRFNCAVIAAHREGTRVKTAPGEITLQAGDVLLLEASPEFMRNNADNSRCFALLSEIRDSAPPRLKMLIPSLLLAVTMLAVYTAGVASLLETALVASGGMLALGMLTQQEVRDAVNWDIYVTIAAAFGIGTAMVNSGVAGGVARGLTALGEGLGMGDAGLFATVYLATFLISNVVTNNAAAALVFPIAMDAADQAGIDVVKMSFNLMLAASASFMSPFGYQTNLMVYGPGGYKYLDFLKIGVPMQVLLWVFTVAVLSVGDRVSPWAVWGFWIVGAVVLVLAVAVRVRVELVGGLCRGSPRSEDENALTQVVDAAS